MNDTASEHHMVERLILDDLFSWAVNYKVTVGLSCITIMFMDLFS